MSTSQNAFEIMKKGAMQTYSTLHMSLHENKTVTFGSAPSNPTWSSKVLICCYDRKGRIERRVQLHKTYTSKEDKFIVKHTQPHINLHLLKSGLQKAIRRKETQQAINIAGHIVNQENGLCEICRRLPIIAIEDSSINSLFPTMIWYMLASSYKNYEHDEDDIEFIIRFVYAIAKSNIRDQMNAEYKGNAPIIAQQNSDIVNSILIREAYGGMKGDMKMLRHAAHVWATRPLELIPFPNIAITISTTILSENDFPLSAFDFHCTNILNKVYSNISMDDMKTAMWIYSSSINLKTEDIHHKIIHTTDHQRFHNLFNDNYIFIDTTNQCEKNWCKIRQQIHSVAMYMRASYF